MSSTASRAAQLRLSYPTIWGLNPVELHDRFWASCGVCIVRAGEPCSIPAEARLFLLTCTESLSIFNLEPLHQAMNWADRAAMFVRVRSSRDMGYRESVLSGEDGRFIKFERTYGAAKRKIARAALTRDRNLAMAWQSQPGSLHPWKTLRKQVGRLRGHSAVVDGRTYARGDERELVLLVHDLIEHWPQPSATLPHVRSAAPGVWACNDFKFDPSVKVIGSTWVGAGRKIEPGESVLGPAALWDDPLHRPAVGDVRWDQLLTAQLMALPLNSHKRSQWSLYRASKRLFDIVASLGALAVTLPLYVPIMLAIWWEDGWPFFYVHQRETRGGSPFPCLKFRSMRKDSAIAKIELQKGNQADGPQFYMPGDPRITRVGRKIRRCNIDELPQFINVLLGHMSIVGPRPSPYSENQCCPAWRETRLSVRPGITGLWQVMRTREPGLDFQEWIRWDVEYVQNAGFLMDMKIILKTIKLLCWG